MDDAPDNSNSMENSVNTESIDQTDQAEELLDSQYHSPEYLQRKLYFLLEKLKTMHSELPE